MIKFNPGDLDPKKAEEQVRKAIVVTTFAVAPQAEAYIKTSAPWTDRTGNARNGLSARPTLTATGGRIDISHGVDYGIWLETRWGQRLAVVMPATKIYFAECMQMIAKLAFRRG